PVDERSDWGTIKSDMRNALDELTVHIDAIDTIATQSTLINLGTFTTAGSLTASMGAPAGAPLAASGQAQLSATRVENIAKELDRRSVWLSRERPTLRIPQRGMMEATISGSIVTVLTLRVPVSSLYALEVTSVKDDDDPPPLASNLAPSASSAAIQP